MSGTPEAPAARSHFVDLTPFRVSPAYFRMWLGASIAGIGAQMTLVAVGLHIYALTGDTGAVALVGVIGLLPIIIAGLYGGVLADTFDRRTVALLAETAAWLSVIGLAVLAWLHIDELWMYYALTTVNAVSVTIVGAARQAIVPRLLPPELLPAAGALGGISIGFQVIVGPAIGGVLVALVGVQWTYTVDAVLFLAAFTGLLTLPRIIPEGSTGKVGFGAVADGLRFLRTAPNIRMTFIVDIIAMTFGQPRVLMPAVGALVIGGGAITVGILSSAFAAGVLLSSIFSGRLGGVRHHGLAVRNAVLAYGGFILLFGLVLLPLGSNASGSVVDSLANANILALVLAAIALVGAGGSDNVSAVFRSTMLQAAVPDHMRGRMQGIFIVVVTGGPRVGDAYVGLVAATALIWLPPVLGGVLIIGLVAWLVAASARFRSYDSLAPTP